MFSAVSNFAKLRSGMLSACTGRDGKPEAEWNKTGGVLCLLPISFKPLQRGLLLSIVCVIGFVRCLLEGEGGRVCI